MSAKEGDWLSSSPDSASAPAAQLCPSRSIAFRSITDVVPREKYARRLGSARANKRKREEAKALHGDRGE